MALGDVRGRVRLLWNNGSPICPALILDSSVLLLASFNPNRDSGGLFSGSGASLDALCRRGDAFSAVSSNSSSSTSRLSAITALGHLLVWNLPKIMNKTSPFTIGHIASALPQLIAESTLANIVQSKNQGWNKLNIQLLMKWLQHNQHELNFVWCFILNVFRWVIASWVLIYTIFARMSRRYFTDYVEDAVNLFFDEIHIWLAVKLCSSLVKAITSNWSWQFVHYWSYFFKLL